jgi:hypothetical protein
VRVYNRYLPMSEALVIRTTLTAVERDRLDRLRRRTDWLRLRTAIPGYPGGDFNRGELSALEWAIRYIEDVAALRTNSTRQLRRRRRAAGSGELTTDRDPDHTERNQKISDDQRVKSMGKSRALSVPGF